MHLCHYHLFSLAPLPGPSFLRLLLPSQLPVGLQFWYLLLGRHPGGGQLHHSGGQLCLDAFHAVILLASMKSHRDQPPEAGTGCQLLPALLHAKEPLSLSALGDWNRQSWLQGVLGRNAQVPQSMCPHGRACHGSGPASFL